MTEGFGSVKENFGYSESFLLVNYHPLKDERIYLGQAMRVTCQRISISQIHAMPSRLKAGHSYRQECWPLV